MRGIRRGDLIETHWSDGCHGAVGTCILMDAPALPGDMWYVKRKDDGATIAINPSAAKFEGFTLLKTAEEIADAEYQTSIVRAGGGK